jgi:hypothetical protein
MKHKLQPVCLVFAGLVIIALPAFARKAPDGLTEHFADVNGTRLHYAIGGKGDAVVLLLKTIPALITFINGGK